MTLYYYRARVHLQQMTNVYDGDTVRMDIDLGLRVLTYDEPLRLYGIDAPELHEPGGKESRDYLRRLLDTPTLVIQTLKNTRERERKGKYGRWLVIIHHPIHGSLNDKMVEAGHAVRYMED